MPFTKFGLDLTREKWRAGKAFVIDTSADPETAHDLGKVRSVSFMLEPVQQEEDTVGRQSQLSYVVETEIELQQTADEDLSAFAEILETPGTIVLTNRDVEEAEVLSLDRSEKVRVENAFFEHSAELTFNGGEESFQTFRSRGRVSREHVAEYFDTASTVEGLRIGS